MEYLVYLAAALIVGALGYWISEKFWATQYSRENTGGDFGSPRGGFFATLGGSLLGMLFVAWVGKYFIPVAMIGGVLIAVMIGGAVGGMLALYRKRS